ncbi:HNH endonuclease [Vibrio sp. 10N.222.55.A1]|uniref:HNH endonuclease n=1 Tax=Vibrio sp. 10N.222.55.A1 TaxID=3229646 RepID=UPI00354EEF18
MFPKHHDFKFCASYKLADSIRTVVFENYGDSPLEVASDFDNQALKPVKNSLLHDYIEHNINEYFYFYLMDAGGDEYSSEEIIQWCNEYDLKVMSPEEYYMSTGTQWVAEETDLFEYHTEYLLDFARDNLTPMIKIEVFNLLFSDRCFLIEFNKKIAHEIKGLMLIDEPELLKKDGVLKRNTYWPKWLERALFCREKGLCAICKTDLSSMYHTAGKLSIDHMVPLNLGGVNDVSNLQLLCQKCNLEKLGDKIVTTNLHPTYW